MNYFKASKAYDGTPGCQREAGVASGGIGE